MTEIKPTPGQPPQLQLSASQSSSDRARLLLRVALSGVQLPFEVFDSALTRATAVLERYRQLDEEAAVTAEADKLIQQEMAARMVNEQKRFDDGTYNLSEPADVPREKLANGKT